MNLILAVDQNYGIGCDGRIPWYSSEELKLFRRITENSVVICGRKTLETLPYLKSRFILYVSKEGFLYKGVNESNSLGFPNLEEAFDISESMGRPIFIIGGKSIYEICLTQCREKISRIYLSVM